VPFFPDLEGKIVDNEDLRQEAIAVLFDLEAWSSPVDLPVRVVAVVMR